MAKHAGSETIEIPTSYAVYISKPDDVLRDRARCHYATTSGSVGAAGTALGDVWR